MKWINLENKIVKDTDIEFVELRLPVRGSQSSLYIVDVYYVINMDSRINSQYVDSYAFDSKQEAQSKYEKIKKQLCGEVVI